MSDLKKTMHFTKEQREWIKAYVILKMKQARKEAINEMADALSLEAIYTETENGWSGMTVDTMQIDEIAERLKEQNNG